MKKVSVIIPAYNAENIIRKCINSVLNQTYKNIDITVIDDCSTDKTADIVEGMNCKLIRLKKNIGYVNILNVGLNEVDGDYIYILDSDCVADKDCVKWIIKTFSMDKQVGVVGGTCTIPKGYKNLPALVYDVTERFKDIRDEEIKAVPYLSGSNLCIKKEVVDKVGDFNKNLISHCDFDYTFRARKMGYKVLFQQKARSYHHNVRNTFKDFFKHIYRGGIYGTIFRLKYREDIPFGKFYPRNWFLLLLISPGFVAFSTARIIKKNLGFRPLKEIMVTLPFLVAGQIIWAFGCIKGTYWFKSGRYG